MMENLILLAFGMAAICGFILGAQLFVWVWDLWDKHQEKRKRLEKKHTVSPAEKRWRTIGRGQRDGISSGRFGPRAASEGIAHLGQ